MREFRMKQLRYIRPMLVCLLFAAAAQAATFTVSLSSGNGQFPGKQPAAFGNTAPPTTVDLTPGVPATVVISQFSGFDQNQVFPHTSGASTTFTQTLTVNGISTTVTRTITLTPVGSCHLDQSLSPVTITVDLGASGRVDLVLQGPPTDAFACTDPPNETPILTPFIIIVPGTSTTILLHDVPGQPSPTPLPPSVILTMTGLAGVGVYETRRRWLARVRAGRTASTSN